MPLNSRDLWLVLKAQDQTNRALNTFSRNVRNAGNQVRMAQLEAAQAASLGTIAQAKLSNEIKRAQIGDLQYQKVLLARQYIQAQLSGSSQSVLDGIQAQHRAIQPHIEDLRGQIAANEGVIAAEKVKLQATRDSIAQLNAYNRSVQDNEKNLAHLSGRIQSVAQTATAAGFAFAAAGAVTLIAIKKSIDVAVEYERQVRATATQISNLSGNLDQLADIGREVARTIAVPFKEIQPALFDIFSSMDVNITEATALLKEFSRAAVAGQTDISSVSRATIGILNAFGLSASDVNKILDLQFTLVQKGIGTYEEWNQRIGLVTPSAVRAGQSIETMVAALAASTRMGISAARSGTAVARAFDALSNPAAVKQLKALGVSVQDAQGKFRPFNEVLREFRAVLMKMPEKDRLATILDVFKGAGGTIEARRFLQNILLGKDNLELFDQILNDTKNSAGAMDKAYGIMADGAAAKTQLLKNQWMLLQESVGKALTPAFVTVVTWVNNLIDKFNQLSPQAKKTFAFVLLGVGVFLALVGPILLVVGAVAAFAAAMAVAGTAIAVTLGIMAGAIAIFAGLAVAFVLLYKHSLEFRVLLGQIGQYFKLLVQAVKPSVDGMVKAFKDNLLPAFHAVWDVISNKVIPAFTIWMNFVVSKVLPKVEEAARIIKDVAGKAFEFIGYVINNLVVPALKFMVNWWNDNKKEIEPLLPIIAQLVKWFLIVAAIIVGVLVVALVGPLVAAVAAVIAVFGLVVAAIIYVIKFVKQLWEWIKEFASWIADVFVAIWDGIVSFFVGVWDAIVGVFNGAMDAIGTLWQSFWDSSIGKFLIAVWDFIVASLELIWYEIKAIFSGAIDAIVALWNAVWPSVRDFFVSIWNSISSFFVGIWNSIVGFLGPKIASVREFISDAWNFVKNATSNAWNVVYGTISSSLSKVWDLITGVFNKIIGFFAGASNWLRKAGMDIIQGLIDGLNSMLDKVTGVLNKITSKIRDFLPGSPVKVGPLKVLNRGYAGGQITKMIAQGMLSELSSVQDAAQAIASQIAGSGYTNADNAYNGANGSGGSQKVINQNITVNTQEIDPRRNSAQLGWELARVM